MEKKKMELFEQNFKSEMLDLLLSKRTKMMEIHEHLYKKEKEGFMSRKSLILFEHRLVSIEAALLELSECSPIYKVATYLKCFPKMYLRLAKKYFVDYNAYFVKGGEKDANAL